MRFSATYDILEAWQRLTGEIPKKVSSREYAVTCPAHEDHRPSCHLNSEKNVALCRSCGWSGNAITMAVTLGIAATPSEARAALARLGVRNR